MGFSAETIKLFQDSNLFRWIIVEADGAAGLPLKAPASHEPVIPACTDWVIGIIGLSALGRPLDKQTVFRPELVSKITGLSEGSEILDKTICDILCHRQGIFQGTPGSAKKIVFLNQADIPQKAQAGQSIIRELTRIKTRGISRVVLGCTSVEAPVLEHHTLHQHLS
jgi:probable selenium-dependent hydroxylase accessory protein YqeC